MKRLLTCAVLAVLILGTAGCSGSPTTGTTGTTTSTPAPYAPYAALAVDGAHEQAALAALPEALKTAATSVKAQKKTPADVTGATATLVDYVVQAQVGDQVALFEFRADGRAYRLYDYPTQPNPQALPWQPASSSEGAFLADPASAKEREAVAAVASIVEIAKPGKKATVKIYGYTFFWLKPDGTPVTTGTGSPFSITIDPKGNAGSWSI